MMQQNKVSDLNWSNVGWQIKSTLLVLSATMAIPFFVHLLPNVGGIPIGARLLPIFYAPLVAVFFVHYRIALLSGLLAPLLNYLLTGRPFIETALILSGELVVFVFIANILNNQKSIRWFVGPFSYIGAKCASFITLSFLPGLANTLGIASASIFFFNSLITALPGLVILFLISFWLVKSKV